MRLKVIGKRALAGLLSILLVVGCCMTVGLPKSRVWAAETTIVDSGTCGADGDNLTWTLKKNVLTIYGEGSMKNYDFSYKNYTPWHDSCDEITTIILEDGAKNIGSYAFAECNNLTDIFIPDSVTSVGDSAFAACSNLVSITIPNSITEIGIFAFFQCYNLKNINIPIGVTSIKDATFRECKSLINITIPDSVTNIGGGAFYGCNSLTNITIPDSVTSIGDGAFSCCSTLTNITIPNSVTGIGAGAFENCTSLTNITILGNITSIDTNTFIICTNLTDITIPSSVTSIGDNAFWDCASLTDVYYTGTEKQWNEIRIDSGNADLTNATIHFNSTGPGSGSDDDGDGVLEIIDQKTSAITLTENHSQTVTFSARKAELSADQVSVQSQDESVAAVRLENVDITNDTGKVMQNLLGTLIITGIAPGQTQVILTYPGVVNTITVTVEEYVEPNIPGDFNESTYRADKLLEPDHPAYENMELTLGYLQSSDETPSRAFLTGLSDSTFSGAVTAWETMDALQMAVNDPTKMIDETVKTQDLYTAMILQCLKVSTESGVTDALKDQTEIVDTIQKRFTDTVRAYTYFDAVDPSSFASLSPAQKTEINETMRTQFEEECPLTLVNDAFEVFNLGLDMFDSLESYIEYVFSGIQLMALTDSTKAVLEEMYDQCPASNTMLRSALADCIEIMDSGTADFMARAAERGCVSVGWQATKYYVGELWDSIYKCAQTSFPAVGYLMAGYDAGKLISNALFSTDATITAYYNMSIMMEIESVACSAYRSLASNYQSSGSVEDAEALLSCSDFLFQVYDSDCVEAKDFVDVLDQAGLNKICGFFGCNDNYDAVKDSIEGLRTSNDLGRYTVSTSWVHFLVDDYPSSDLYDRYSYLLDAEREKMVNKEYRVACPVDVLVYDQSTGELAAAVIDGKISNNDPENLTVIVDGEEKIFWMAEGADYKLTLIGSDTGTMDITVNEFDEEENVIRTVSYDEVPLTNGKTYEATVNSQSLEEGNYTLTDLSNSGTVTKTQDTLDAGDTTYTLQVNLGIASVNGQQGSTLQVTLGQIVNLIAYVPDGYTFLGWTAEQGSVSFEDNTVSATTFRMPAGNVTITANLQQTANEPYDLNGDGMVNVADVMSLAQFVVNERSGLIYDFNQDNIVDVLDVMFLAQEIVNMK